MTDTLPGDPLPPSEVTPAEESVAPIAPWFHTLAVLALLAAFSFLAHFGHHETMTISRPLRYGSQILMIWMMLGCVVAGLYRRRLFLWSTLVHNRSSWFEEFVRGIAIYVACMVAFSLIVVMFTSILRRADPAHSAAIHQQVLSHLHLKNKAVESIAPRTALELLVWIGVSFTAGFCEEHIFRGYLLRQALAFFSSRGTSSRFATVLSIATTSILFGSLHVYEGIGGAIFIGLLGVIYAILALRFGNLRAVIIAHTAQDFLVGLFSFLRHIHPAP
jgi:uncharacterized protein